MGHIRVGDDLLGIGIGETPFHHDVKGKFAHDLIPRTVGGLSLYETGDFVFGGGHGVASGSKQWCHGRWETGM